MTEYNSAKAVLVVTLATGIGRLLGFVREITMAAKFGTGMENDAFIMALTLPDIVLGIVAVSLSTSLIPVYLEVRKNHGERAGHSFISSALLAVIGFTLVVSVLTVIYAANIVGLLAPGFSIHTRQMAVQLLIIFIPMITLTSVISVFTGYLQANLKFFIPALISIPLNAVVIGATIWLTKFWGIYVIAWGYLVGTVFQVGLVYWAVRRTKIELRANFFDSWPYLKQTSLLLLPVLIGSSVTQINALVGNYLASGLPEGSISALYYANKLVLFPHSVLIMSFATVAFPSLSQTYVESKELFSQNLSKWLNIMLLFILPLTVGFMVLQKPIIETVFEHGRFDTNSTRITTQALEFYALGLPAYGLRELFNRAFYAMQNTRIPMLNGVIAMVLNISLNFALVGPLQHMGLALAASLASMTTVLLLFFSLLRRGLFAANLALLVAIGKYLLAASIMGVGSYFLYNYSGLQVLAGKEVAFLTSIILGSMIYFAAVTILSPALARQGITKLKQKLATKGLKTFQDRGMGTND